MARPSESTGKRRTTWCSEGCNPLTLHLWLCAALLSATVRPMRVPHSTAHSAVVSHTRRHHEPACYVPTCEHAAKDAAEADGRGHWPATTTSQHPINHTLPSPGVNSHMLFLRLHLLREHAPVLDPCTSTFCICCQQLPACIRHVSSASRTCKSSIQPTVSPPKW